MNSLHYVLKSHEIIPKTLEVADFYKEHGIKMMKDDKMTDKDMKKICKSIQISHDIEGLSQSVVDGINVQLLEKNKLKDFITLGGKKKSVIMVKDDGIFNPVYIKYDGSKHGMFKPDNNILDKMF